jgi:hypothetical protein
VSIGLVNILVFTWIKKIYKLVPMAERIRLCANIFPVQERKGIQFNMNKDIETPASTPIEDLNDDVPNGESLSRGSDPFWGDDISILFQKDRLVEFFPTADQTLPERMNAVTRLVIYVSIILSVYQEKSTAIHFGILLLGVMFLMYKNQTIFKLSQGDVSLSDAVSTLERFEDKDSKNCVMPTLQNPFMNFMPGDLPGRAPACKGSGVQEMASNLLDQQLFSDVDDLFSRNANQRQFRTMPETRGIPDRERYAHWLVKGEEGCKTTGDCRPFEDLRHQRQLIPEDLDKELNVTGFNL